MKHIRYFNKICRIMWPESSSVNVVNLVKKSATIPEISNFSWGITFLACPVYGRWIVHEKSGHPFYLRAKGQMFVKVGE